MTWQTVITGGALVLVAYAIWRLIAFGESILPRPADPAPITPGCDPGAPAYADTGERLTAGSVYRFARPFALPMPDEGGSLTSECLNVPAGWWCAVQAGGWPFWYPWAWWGLSPGELGLSNLWPRYADRAVRYNREAAKQLQAALIRAGVLVAE